MREGGREERGKGDLECCLMHHNIHGVEMERHTSTNLKYKCKWQTKDCLKFWYLG